MFRLSGKFPWDNRILEVVLLCQDHCDYQCCRFVAGFLFLDEASVFFMPFYLVFLHENFENKGSP